MKSERFDKIHSYVMAVLLLINTPLMWKCFIPFPDYVARGLLLAACAVGIVTVGRARVPERWLPVAGFMSVYLIIYIIGSNYDPIGGLLNLLMASLVFGTYCCSLIWNRKLELLVNAFVNVMCVVAGVSLFFWLFGSVLNILPGGKIVEYDWAEYHLEARTYFGMYYEVYAQNNNIMGMPVPRNCGIFPEAPGHSSFLLYALGVALFATAKRNIFKVLLLLATLVSTQSTKSYIVIIMVLCAWFVIDNRKISSKKLRVAKNIFSATMICLAGAAVILILKDKGTTGSFAIRMDDVFASIKTWKENMVFGSGYENDLSIVANTTVGRKNNGLSMGFFVLLAEGGLVMVAFYLLSFIAGLVSRITAGRKIEYLMFSLLIFLNLVASNEAFTMQTIMIISCGYAAFACSRRDATVSEKQLEQTA